MIISIKIKKVIVYALLCVYSFALLKPLMPIANDIIAHTFYKIEHISTIHYENGRYHLHAELSEDNTKNNTSQSSTPISLYETLANHISLLEDKSSVNQGLVISFLTSHQTKHPLRAFVKNTSPPPKALPLILNS
jgi:hypothetical protein